MEKKENQRVLLTKRLLQEGLLRLLKKKNINKINVSELCKEAGINRATFYKHYGSPHDVLAEIENNLIQHLQETENQMKKKNKWPLERLLEEICSYLYNNADLVRILIKNNMDSDISNTFFDKLPQKQSTLYEYIEKRSDEYSITLVSTFIGSGSYNLIRQWLMEDIPKSPQEIASLIFEIATRGCIQNEQHNQPRLSAVRMPD